MLPVYDVTLSQSSCDMFLQVSGYYGNADDALAGGTGQSLSGQNFSTYDADRDSSINNCASSHKGVWLVAVDIFCLQD